MAWGNTTWSNAIGKKPPVQKWGATGTSPMAPPPAAPPKTTYQPPATKAISSWFGTPPPASPPTNTSGLPQGGSSVNASGQWVAPVRWDQSTNSVGEDNPEAWATAFNPNPVGGYAPGALVGTSYDVAAPPTGAPHKGSRQRADGTWESGTWSTPPGGGEPVFTPDSPGGASAWNGGVTQAGPTETFSGAIANLGGLFNPSRIGGVFGAIGGPDAANTPGPGANIATQGAEAAFKAPNWSATELQNANPLQRTDEAYRDFMRSTPADMGAFYERGKERAAADLNTQFGARGMFGSSAATGAIGQAFADIEAQRAKEEADYGLSRAGLAGSLGQGADASSIAAILGRGKLAKEAGDFDINRASTLGDIGSAIEGRALDRMSTVADIAGTGDRGDLERGRFGLDLTEAVNREAQDSANTMLEQMGGEAQSLMQTLASQYQSMNQDEKEIFDAIQTGGLAAGKAAYDAAQARGANVRADIGLVLEGASTVNSMGKK